MMKKRNVKNVKIMIPKARFASDTFVCDTCGTRMFLKVMGDKTPCRVEGCNGTMNRV